MIRNRLSPIVTLGVLILHTPAVAAPEPARALGGADDPRRRGIEAVETLMELGLELPSSIPAPPAPGLPDAALRLRDGVRLLTAEGELEDDSRPRRHQPDPLGWDPWQGPIDLRVAAHLCNRALIGPRFEEFQTVQALGIEDAVDWLLEEAPVPPPPGDWITIPIPHFNDLTPAQVDSVLEQYARWGQELRMWWVDRIVNDQTGVTETMTHFWHDHFANELNSILVPQSMYRQNDLFRRHALGNVRDLVREVAKDPAMLIYLDGYRNRVGNPNENFARELMELFTMGEGSGYTQTDVEEVARACTGWQTDGIYSYFNPIYHDPGWKTVLGRTGRWDVDDVVDILFEQEATAEYLCGKLYRWFVDDEPSPEDIRTLAGILRAHDYEVKPLLAVIFRSKHLLDIKRFRGSIVRDGVDIYAGQLRRFHVFGFNPADDIESLESRWVWYQMHVYGHVLLDPPNVAGWPGHRDWLNAYTLPVRKFLSTTVVDGRVNGMRIGFGMNAMNEAKRFTDPDDPYALVDDTALLCFGHPPTEAVREAMLDELLQGTDPYAWSLELPGARERIEDLFRLAMRLPDYQLK